MTDFSEWQPLIQKHLDGQTTEEEANALSHEIETNAELRSDYLNAARIHGALADEVISLDLESTAPSSSGTRSMSWARPLAAIVAGAFVGLLGVGVVWAINSPKSEERIISVSNGDFEETVGPVPLGFPSDFGHWSGDPAEIIEEDGNRILRFLETANVTGKPNGGASACNVFQLIDLTSLQQEWDTGNSDSHFTLDLSARFRREAAPTDAELPKIKASCTIHLYQANPDSIGKAWPQVISEAIAIGNKVIRLKPGEEGKTITASCVLEPEATIALISVNVNTSKPTTTPIELGGFYADDVQLTVIRQPGRSS